MPKQSDELVALDSEDNSVSVAEARHLARRNMLIPALDKLFELGMNSEVKEAVRANVLQFIVNFASEAQGNGSKQVGKLSPAAARIIAKLGLPGQGTPSGGVPSDEAKGERVRPGGADDFGDDGKY